MQDRIIFKCYSGKLKKWLLERNHFLVMRTKDYHNFKTIWLFLMTNRMSEDLKLWSKNNPNKRLKD